MGRRASGRWKCRCPRCVGLDREKFNKRFEAQMLKEALTPVASEEIYDDIWDVWFDWDEYYDL